MIDFQITKTRPVIRQTELLSVAQKILCTLVELFLPFFRRQGRSDNLKSSAKIDIYIILCQQTQTIRTHVSLHIITYALKGLSMIMNKP